MSTQPGDSPNTQMSCAEYYSIDAQVCWLNTESGILAEDAYSQNKDKRISDLVSAPDNNGYVYSLKFTDKAQKQDWIPVMRYAETLLNLAECYTHSANGTTQARNALKEVRSRSIAAGDDMLDVDALSGGNLTTAVLKERRLEFICEGIRGIDIIRRGENFVKNYHSVNLDVAPTASNYFWPIPNAEINYNKTLGKK